MAMNPQADEVTPDAVGPRLVVTTALKARSGLWQRAEVVAARCQVPLLPREGLLADKLDEHEATHVYLVGNLREEVQDRAGHQLYLHLGMMRQRRLAGPGHPLLRAVQPEGAMPVKRVLDCTLGRAGDAHHLAYALEAEVLGLETSPVLFSLLEEGIERISRMPRPVAHAMTRVRAAHSEANDFLARQPDDSFDVVYLDPMVRRPQKGQPGFDLLRVFADHERPSLALFEHAARVASRRVVMKLPPGEPEPPAPFAWTRLFSRKMSYVIHEKELAGGE